MSHPIRSLERLDSDRLEGLVRAAAYGTVLVLGSLTLVSVSDIALGHGAELVAGVGLATWVAHFFAEVLGEHVKATAPLTREQLWNAAIDGTPIPVATLLPATVLLLGRLETIDARAARIVAIIIALAQLFLIGAFVSRVGPLQRAAQWLFASVIVCLGLVVAALTTLLKH